MKRTYTSPMAEKVQFEYQEQVVASNTTTCQMQYSHEGVTTCENGWREYGYVGNEG